MTINSENLLPNPNIVKKLEALKPGSGEAILSLMETIVKQQHAEDLDQLSRPRTFKEKCDELRAAFFRGMSMPMDLSTASPEACATYYTQNMAVPTDLMQAGNFMRRAILRYMEENNIAAETLGLTPQEKDSLTILPLNIAPAPRNLT